MLRTARHAYAYGCKHLQHTRSFVALAEVASVNASSTQLLSTSYQRPRSCVCNLNTSATCRTSGHEPEQTRVKVISIPNPFTWLHNQMELATLRKEWDANFSTERFKAGVRQAVCTSTELITEREWGELRGLISQKAISKIRTIQWTADQVNNLILDPQSIQVTTIDNVSLQTIVDRKYCDIDVTVIGTRKPHDVDKHALVVLEYFVRFHREYTDGVLPEWTITLFKLKHFEAQKKVVHS